MLNHLIILCSSCAGDAVGGGARRVTRGEVRGEARGETEGDSESDAAAARSFARFRAANSARPFSALFAHFWDALAPGASPRSSVPRGGSASRLSHEAGMRAMRITLN